MALIICHCTDCQTLTCSAFRINIPAPAEHFVLRSDARGRAGNRKRVTR